MNAVVSSARLPWIAEHHRIAAMAYFRRRGEVDPSRERLLDEAAAKLDVFCA